MLWAELSILNKPSVYRNYQKIITSKYTSNDAVNKMLIRNKANKDLNRVVEAQVERLSRNVDYVESVLKNYTVPLKEYQKMRDAQENRSVANRRVIIENVLKARDEINRSEGLNIPTGYNYRDLDVTAEQLLRESQSASEYEEVLAMNEQAENEGKSALYTQKKWIWTGEGKTTRHANMESYPVIDLDNTFQVVNDITDTMDEMLYPRDINGSPENVYGCVCEVEYL